MSFAEMGFDGGPAHTFRHVGPSEDLAGDETGKPYRTQNEVRNRGRWRAKTSVLRYGKTHALIAARSRVPEWVHALGTAEIKKLGQRAAVAVV